MVISFLVCVIIFNKKRGLICTVINITKNNITKNIERCAIQKGKMQ